MRCFLALLLLAALAPALACSSESIYTAPFTCAKDPIHGEPTPSAEMFEALRIAAGVDALEARAVTTESGARGWAAITVGKPCAVATDYWACDRAYTELSSKGEALYPAFAEGAQVLGVPGYFLAYTKGDAVGKISNLAELRTFYPSVDTPAKAALFAYVAGYRVECQRDGWLHEEPDGWVLLTSRGHEKRCSRTDVVLLVRRDGTTAEREVAEEQPDPCT